MNDNESYANYMLAWIDKLGISDSSIAQESLLSIKRYWSGDKSIDLMPVIDQIWSWVDSHGGPRIGTDKEMLSMRMILCATSADNRELEDMGFFEDLVHGFGVPREVINSYDRNNPPCRA